MSDDPALELLARLREAALLLVTLSGQLAVRGGRDLTVAGESLLLLDAAGTLAGCSARTIGRAIESGALAALEVKRRSGPPLRAVTDSELRRWMRARTAKGNRRGPAY